MELLIFGHSGAKVLVFPTREGRFFDYENWGLVEALAPSIDAGYLQLYCVDSVDSESLYCGWRIPSHRIERHRQYEQYILLEVVPLMRSGCADAFLIAHGCSIGAYHAVTMALRHPGLFGKVVALSGRYDLTRAVAPFTDLFDGYYDHDIYQHTPNHFLPDVSDQRSLELLRNTEFLIAVGESDPFLESTTELSHLLRSKGISHQLAIWEGEAHRARYWRMMVPLYL